MDMIIDPWFYAVAVPAVLLVGLSKGGFAGGLGILGVPMMALVISPLQAAGILLPILIVMDLIGVWAYRKSFHLKNLAIMVPGAAIGILIAALTASYVTDNFVRLLVGGIAVAFALDHWIGRRAEAAPKDVNQTKGISWGAVGGFTSFVAHAGGPPFQIYMLPQKLDKRLYVGTSVMFFWAVNLRWMSGVWTEASGIGKFLSVIAVDATAGLVVFAMIFVKRWWMVALGFAILSLGPVVWIGRTLG